ncbi:hypothetical protein [Arthrobacter sp. Z1-15]
MTLQEAPLPLPEIAVAGVPGAELPGPELPGPELAGAPGVAASAAVRFDFDVAVVGMGYVGLPT